LSGNEAVFICGITVVSTTCAIASANVPFRVVVDGIRASAMSPPVVEGTRRQCASTTGGNELDQDCGVECARATGLVGDMEFVQVILTAVVVQTSALSGLSIGVASSFVSVAANAIGVVYPNWKVRQSTSEEDTQMAKLQVGDQAPDFTATAQDGSSICLSDFVGKKAMVLFFYPKDHSPICTKEACSFRDSYERFVDAGAEVVGVSNDSSEEHQTFAGRHRLPFKLISDSDGSLRKAFGVPKAMGVLPGRTTYVIDKQGVVRLEFTAQLAADEHVEKAISALR
jgi:peroxiredoxin Q/BCP